MLAFVKKAGLYWRTIKYLRPSQIIGRVRFRMAIPKLDLRVTPELGSASGTWVSPSQRGASLTGAESFMLLGDPGTLALDGWDNPARPKLWRYNQHYFDDLNAVDAEHRRNWHERLIARWIRENAVPGVAGLGSGWEPYPVSLRIVNWSKYALSGESLSPEAERSLALQARWLIKRLEFHLRGNHLFSNAKALLYAGVLFEGSEAETWLSTGLRILDHEVSEQILPDGGHFELSPMYHALALEDMLDLVNLVSAFPDRFKSHPRKLQLQRWRDVIPGMLRWLAATSHPDGRISFFNDAAFGIAPENSELFSYAGRLGFAIPVIPASGITDLADSGLCRIVKGPAVVILDMADIGPDYLPGHAHADTLSFEMSLFGRRLFVNSGTSVYGLGAERLRQRGTPAHNTVTVDGANSSEVWSSFRVGARARVNHRRVDQDGNTLLASAVHAGYRRLVRRLDHRRELQLDNQSLAVYDQISRLAPAEARYHLHPGVKADLFDTTEGMLTLPNGQTVEFVCEIGKARLEQTTWHPEFGKTIENLCLVIDFDGQNACLNLNW